MALRILKEAAYSVVKTSGLMPAVRRHFAGPGAILMFHEIHTSGDAELRTGVTADFLDDLIRWLHQNAWDVLSLDDCVQRLRHPDSTKRRFAALTFDDGYRDNVQRALPVLERHNAPFTIYIPTGAPKRTLFSWWLGLRQLFTERDSVEIEAMRCRFDTRDASAKEAALDTVCRWIHQDYERKAMLTSTFDKAGISLEALNDRYFMDEEELMALSRHPLASIGGHTSSHAAISTLHEKAAVEEMTSNRAYLQDLLQLEIPHFAFPYGNQNACGDRDFEIAKSVGFSSAVTTDDAPVSNRSHNMFGLPRIGIRNNDSAITFDARISGLRKVAGRWL